MSYFRTEKVISSLPAQLEADTIYFVRDGAGYRLVVSDTTGSITYEQNLPAATQAEVIAGTVDDKAVTPATLKGSNVSRILVTSASQLSGTLDSTKLYFIDGQIDMGGQSITVPPTGLSIGGNGLGISRLTSTEDNYTMFISDGTYSGPLIMASVDIVCSGTGSQVFDLDNEENLGPVSFDRVTFLNCTSLGELSNYVQLFGINLAWFSCLDGVTLSGSWAGSVAIIDSVYSGAPMPSTGTLFKASANLTIDGVLKSNVNVLGLGTGGAAFCDFAPSNITRDSGFILNGVTASEGSDIIPNMPASSTKALIKNCVGVDNTYQGAAMTPVVDSVIPIATVDTLYQITGAITIKEAYWFSVANTNGLRLDSNSRTEFRCSGTMSFSGAANSRMVVQLRKFVNASSSYVNIGPEFISSLSGGVLGATSENVSFRATTDLSLNDRIEIWVKNITNDSNITILAGGELQVFER
jgi:hypothetical protein